MKILIAGFGYVGQELASLLLAEGHELLSVRRSPASQLRASWPADDVRHKVNLIQADLSEIDSLSQLPSQIDAVIYAVAPGERSDEAYRRAYPHGLSNLLKRLPQARFLMISSTSVYAQDEGQTITEQSPALAETFSALRIREAEQLLLSRLDNARHVVLRSSGIYGPGRTRLLSSLAGESLDEQSANTWTSRIHRDDLARSLVHLLKSDEMGVFIASDPQPSTMGQMQTWLKSDANLLARLDVPAPVKSRHANPQARKSRKLFPERLLNCGFVFHYPSYQEGYRQILSA